MKAHLVFLLVLAAVVAASVGAFTTSAGAAAAAPRATVPTGTTTQVGSVAVKLTVNRFVRRGSRLYAIGTAITKFKPTDAKAADYPTKTVRRAFTAPVRKLKRVASAKRICPVLDLTLGPLDLNLLGLMVHLDRVHLTITADSNGGVLGSLLCGLAGSGRLTPQTIVLTWTRAAQQSGLATKGVNFGVGLYQTTSSNGTTTLSTSPNVLSPLAICSVLDLTLGPLHLNLLGLIVDLNRVHLTITADSEGGILGQLLCGLAGGP